MHRISFPDPHPSTSRSRHGLPPFLEVSFLLTSVSERTGMTFGPCWPFSYKVHALRYICLPSLVLSDGIVPLVVQDYEY